MGLKVAVVGAVGYEMLKTLAERDFPADEVVALASRNSAGRLAHGHEHVVIDPGPHPVRAPATEIPLDRAAGREVLG